MVNDISAFWCGPNEIRNVTYELVEVYSSYSAGPTAFFNMESEPQYI